MVNKLKSSGSFHSASQVFFNGHSFSQEDTTCTSDQRTKITSLCSKQKGVAGRLVRRIGWKKVCEARSRINQRVTTRVEEGVSESLDEAVAEVVQELNGLIAGEVAEMLELLDKSSVNWQAHLSVTEKYMQAVIGPTESIDTNVARELPMATGADIEVWVRLSTQDAILLGLASVWNDSNDLLKSLLPVPIERQRELNRHASHQGHCPDNNACCVIRSECRLTRACSPHNRYVFKDRSCHLLCPWPGESETTHRRRKLRARHKGWNQRRTAMTKCPAPLLPFSPSPLLPFSASTSPPRAPCFWRRKGSNRRRGRRRAAAHASLTGRKFDFHRQSRF